MSKGNSKDESQEIINIDGKSYYRTDLSKNCMELLGSVQVSNQALELFSVLLGMARMGIEQQSNDARKLLPDPIETEEEVVEEPTIVN